ncbi:MAG: glutamate acetyltransferase [Nostoc sp. GBBB01]|uniref:Glutamate acetyltransferase n=2 Tax=Nostoc punctiforme TaxID=272131 RepID=A0ABR8H6Y1_NOSPU|nr:glutamate acetyltransferase [Nostoc punctiforme FACHB-252]MBL1198982.1 glutamate acetyltransferase [Nostoc sp. GBBB01]
MYKEIQAFKYTSFKRLIYDYLTEDLSINTESIKNEYIRNKKIPLYKDRNSSKILYTSSVALQVSNSQNRKVMELASDIALHLSATCGDVFNIQIVPSGLIHFELTDSALGTWLQSLVGEMGRWGGGEMREMGRQGDKGTRGQGRRSHNQCPMPNAQCPMPNFLFPIQHAHARCCSLVLLGHREGLIQLREPQAKDSSSFGNLISPNPVPWLNGDGRLQFNQPDEYRLIGELVGVVDNIECPDIRGSVKWEKAAFNLSQAFEDFWRNCRIWGEVKIMSPELAQARLGLLMATQSVLKFILEEKLKTCAPLEL